jgi:hypothetical protein
MDFVDLLTHTANFVAPCIFVGFFMAMTAPRLFKTSPQRYTLLTRSLLNSLAALLAMTAGLWFFGNDGKMVSYLGMALASALSQLWLGRR